MHCLKFYRQTKGVFKVIDTFVKYSTVQFDGSISQTLHDVTHAVPPATLLHLLAGQNTEYVFGNSFLQELLPITEQYYMCKYVECKSAADAGFFAGGLARSTGRTGVVLVSGMTGVLGMMTPLLDAKLDGIPLLMLSVAEGQDTRWSSTRDQAIEITRHITKESLTLSDLSTNLNIVEHAFDITTRDRPGPVHIHLNLHNKTVKEKVVTSGFDAKKISTNLKKSEHRSSYIYENGHLLDETPTPAFQKVADLINRAERPIIIAGHGCQTSNEELLSFAEKANIPVCTTILGIGTFDPAHPLSLNWCGVFGYPAANALLQEATLIIAVGSRFDERCIGKESLFGKVAKEAQRRGEGGFIHCDIRKSELNRIVRSNYFINSECKHFLCNINNFVEFKERKEWFSEIDNVKRRLDNRTWLGIKPDDSLTERNVLSCLDRNIADRRDNTVITCGVGMHQMVAAQELSFPHTRSFLTSGSAAAMGACLGFAVGTKYAMWSKDVICVIGDGDFNMSLTAFETIAEYKIPIKILLLNNKSLLMIEVAQTLMFDGRLTGVETPHCDYITLADAVGMKRIHCNDPADLESKMAEFLCSKGPILFHADVSKSEKVGFVPANMPLDDMIVFEKC